MMPMINCERRRTRLWNYGESSREFSSLPKRPLLALMESSLKPLNNWNFSSYIWQFFHGKGVCCCHTRSLRRNATLQKKKPNQSKLLQIGKNFVWKRHSSHLPFSIELQRVSMIAEKMDENCSGMRKSYFWVTSKFFLHDWSNPSISIPIFTSSSSMVYIKDGRIGSRSDFFESQSTIKKVDWTVMIQRYNI